MKDKVFLDTNLFIYNFDTENKTKHEKSKEIVLTALAENNYVISYQVIQEFSNVALKKFQIPLKPKDLAIYLKRVMFPLCSVYYTNENILNAIEIRNRYKLSFYDSVLIGSAIEANCKTLLSEDLQDGLQIKGLQITNPFNSTIKRKSSLAPNCASHFVLRHICFVAQFASRSLRFIQTSGSLLH
ncbi:PIN domain protein [Leptospira interrogans serovar Grippotyphosa str. LT2186]|uniref:PIN domain protein n=1 Tax=Leptospira interrogans serovar Grippotyphosa str. LT2186 TaxID=1001599 RepID=M3FR54_LEPIR|nr:PIN domain protein [Leptospira interrogans serovar Grippotyphosa str. LT2186]